MLYTDNFNSYFRHTAFTYALHGSRLLLHYTIRITGFRIHLPFQSFLIYIWFSFSYKLALTADDEDISTLEILSAFHTFQFYTIFEFPESFCPNSSYSDTNGLLMLQPTVVDFCFGIFSTFRPFVDRMLLRFKSE